MRDFTLKTHNRLLKTLQLQGFSFLSFEEIISKSVDRYIILRQDVDALPENSLQFARIQADLGIKGTYYFRIVPESFNARIIGEIYRMGQEVGYHYEDVSLAAKRQRAQDRGLKEEDMVKMAIDSFRENLENLRKIVPMKTICMHGSPMSRWDSRLLWKYYDYHNFGITGEPYFDINFEEVLYLTDTGRRWDGEAVSVRDKAEGRRQRAEGKDMFSDWKVKPVKYRTKDTKDNLPLSPSPPLPVFPSFHSTFDIIKAAEDGTLPDKIMMTFHPQRWTDKPVPWVKELVWQNVKNVGKFFLVKLRE